ncbi:GNAT family N-acetyltransferase [Paralysiella testudinis]|uniref:GNAT family N-acetyltransferase n=1 Tax=Paralysiella testudinis TaxID=2809020 RepID=A0A892ZH55_9NEIS|nr:GNAT family N-acetyltransferase [Paralysiella testudinis]QRQ82855.1 GNAT family N-acetyltransferase [Paralysiella testudinis]
MALSVPEYRILPFDTALDRKAFCCDIEVLNHYLQTQVSQDIKRRIAACFMVVTTQQQIAGYYTLASTSVALTDLPETMRKKLPRYPSVPAVLMGRLAIDRKHTGKHLGSALLADGLLRAASSEIAAYALVVDAKDDRAVAFYRHFGFISFTEKTDKLFYPLANVGKAC